MNLDVKGRAIRTLSPRGYSIPSSLEKCPRPFQPRSTDPSKIQGLRHKKPGTGDNFVLSPNPHSYVSGNFTIIIHISTNHFVVYHFSLFSAYFSSLLQHGDRKNKEKHPCHQNMLCRVRINASIGSSGSGPT